MDFLAKRTMSTRVFLFKPINNTRGKTKKIFGNGKSIKIKLDKYGANKRIGKLSFIIEKKDVLKFIFLRPILLSKYTYIKYVNIVDITT